MLCVLSLCVSTLSNEHQWERLLAAWLSSLSVSPLLRVCLVQPSEKRSKQPALKDAIPSNPCLALSLILTRSNFIVQYYRIHTDILKIVIYLFIFFFFRFLFKQRGGCMAYKLNMSDRYHTIFIFLLSIPWGIRIGNGNDEKHLFFRNCRT